MCGCRAVVAGKGASPGAARPRAGHHGRWTALTKRRMMRIEELDTPVPVIDLDRVEHNLAKMQAYCDGHGSAPAAAHQDAQDAGVRAPAGRARRMRHHLPEARRGRGHGGCGPGRYPDLLSADRSRPRRCVWPRLRGGCGCSVAVDNPLALETAAQAARASGQPIGVLVEFDSGNKRTGVTSVDQALGSRARAHCGGRATLRRADDLSESRRRRPPSWPRRSRSSPPPGWRSPSCPAAARRMRGTRTRSPG